MVNQPGGGSGLHTATNAGQVIRRLSPAEARIFPSGVRLSPDGKQALYVAQQPDRSQQLWVVNLTEGTPKQLLAATKSTDIRARWSPDGARIAFSSRQFDAAHGPFFHLGIVDAAGQHEVILKKESAGLNAPILQLTDWR